MRKAPAFAAALILAACSEPNPEVSPVMPMKAPPSSAQLPPIDLARPEKIETATFATG
jgi:hypothetical protein